MRKALDTSVVTCPGGGRRRGGKQRLGSEPSSTRSPAPAPPGPRAAGSDVLPQSPTSAGAAAQRSPGAARRSGRRPGPGVRGGEAITGKPMPLPLLKAPLPPARHPRPPPHGHAHLGRQQLSQCSFGDLDVTFLDPSLSSPQPLPPLGAH